MTPTGAALSSLLLVLLSTSYFIYTFYVYTIMPEILYQFGAVATLLCLIALNSVNMSRWRFVLLTAASVSVSTFTFYIKPHWAGAMIFTWLIVVYFYLRRKDITAAFKGFYLLAILLLTVVLFHYPSSYLKSKYDPGSTLFGAKTLFCNHIELVEPVLDRYVADEAILADVKRDFMAVKLMPEEGWTIHGYSGDHCFYTLNTPGMIKKNLSLTPSEYQEILIGAFFSGVKHQPVEYLKKIFRQFLAAIEEPYISDSKVGHPPPTKAVFDEMSVRDDFLKLGIKAIYYDQALSHPLTNKYVDISSLGRYLLDKLDDNSRGLFVFILIIFIADLSISYKKGSKIFAVIKSWDVVIISIGLYLASLSVVAASHTFDVQRYSQFSSMLAIFYQIYSLIIIHQRIKLWFFKR